MKNKLLLILALCSIAFIRLNAQEVPKPATPAPPIPPAAPAPPAPPQAPDAPAPPATPAPDQKTDTTIISIGDKQIIIINTGKNSGEKAEWEEELEEGMRALKESLEEAREEMEKSHEEMEQSHEEMERELKIEKEENQSPDGKNKLKLKIKKDKENKVKKKKAADIDFIDFDFGVNLLTFGNSITKEMENDLQIKTYGSWTYTFTFLPTKIYLGTPNLMLMTGLGWRIGQLEFKEKVDFEPNKTLVYTKVDNLKKSQFMMHHLQIPLTLYWKSKRIKGLGDLGLGVGAYAGLLISHELETETNDPKRDIETNEDFGFKDFRYGISARADIGVIKLFANFDMNKLWKDHDIKNIECGIWFDF